MAAYTKPIIRSDQGQEAQEQKAQEKEAQEQCKAKLQTISKASNLEMYLSAPDGQLSVLVEYNGQQQVLTQAENFHELLNILKAIQVYIVIMKTVVTCRYMEQH